MHKGGERGALLFCQPGCAHCMHSHNTARPSREHLLTLTAQASSHTPAIVCVVL